MEKENNIISPYAFPGLINTRDHPVIKRSRVDIIIDYICEHFKLSKGKLFQPRRFTEQVQARQLCWYLFQKYTFLSTPEIGRMFGGKDHTTILHGIKKVYNTLDVDDNYKAQVAAIEYNLENINEFTPVLLLDKKTSQLDEDRASVYKYYKHSKKQLVYEQENKKATIKDQHTSSKAS